MDQELRERMVSIETTCKLTRESHTREFKLINAKIDKLYGMIENDIAHTNERLNYLEQQWSEEKGKRYFLNNWIKPLLIGVATVVTMTLLEWGIKLWIS